MWLVGKSYCGKSALAREMAKELGIVHLGVKRIIDHFLTNPFDVQAKKLKKILRMGGIVPDGLVADLIYKRTQFPDVVKNGYVLTGWPKTMSQAQLLIERNIVPLSVLCYEIDDWTVKNRAAKFMSARRFKLDKEILEEKLRLDGLNIPMIEQFFLINYQNFRYLPSSVAIDSNLIKIRTELKIIL
jgi:adenylate kinase family enzyme